jgi:hypothetical protein
LANSTLADSRYAVNQIQVRQTDVAGNVSDVGVNSMDWVIFATHQIVIG